MKIWYIAPQLRPPKLFFFEIRSRFFGGAFKCPYLVKKIRSVPQIQITAVLTLQYGGGAEKNNSRVKHKEEKKDSMVGKKR